MYKYTLLPSILLTIILLAGFSSCSDRNRSKTEGDSQEQVVGNGHQTFADLDYINGFPKELKVTASPDERFDMVGTYTFFLEDTVLFVSKSRTSDLIYAFNKDNGRLIGSFLKKGNGPGELLSTPALSISSFRKDGGNLIFSFFDDKGHVLDVDFSESLRKGRAVIKGSEDLAGNEVMHCIKLADGSGTYITTLKPNLTGIQRYISRNGEEVNIPFMEELNKNSIKGGDGFLFNLVGVHANCNLRLNRMVEAFIYLNTIHLYDVDGPFSRSLSFDRKLSDTEVLEQNGVMKMKKINYCLMVYRDFFAVLHEDSGNKFVCLFDWDGKPLARILVDPEIEYFDIDVKDGQLFGFCNEDETLRIYDIKQLGSLVYLQGRF